MREMEIVTAEEYNRAANSDIQLGDGSKNLNRAPYFVEYIQKNLEDLL